jgi:1-acyl-sn-glycerol-3-phosphate acyltransferase
VIYWIGYKIFHLLSWLFFPRRIEGFENLPVKGGFILASNHVSNLDPFIIGICFPRRVSFVAKEDLFKNKIFGSLMWQWGAFPIKRNATDFKALREALRRLKLGSPLVIFPEGTRIIEKKKPMPGIGFLAVKSRVPVIPVNVSNSDKVLPRGALFPRRNEVIVKFGQPIYFTEKASYQDIVQDILEQIDQLGKTF